ncbi:methyltransferase domain-containing protein [Luteibacter sp. RCC_6_2]|uniref:class I SAM-dependent methyltransferase n=1 Tax=Luteibacter sp. RCC_6_2 TaxID=3239223 RepID=UPI003525C0FC
MNRDNAKWFNVVLASQHQDGLTSPLGDPLPRFPSESMQRNTTGLAGDDALRQAFAFYEDIIEGIRSTQNAVTSEWQVMDFGIGWARVARLFLGVVPARNIHGIDVDPEFIELTRSLFPGGNFRVCEPFPQTHFDENSLDLVTAYSVFSHLSEASCVAWIGEFSRILKPGGYVAFTTRDPSFFAYLEWARNQGDNISGYTKALGELFADLGDARARYDRGEFVHATSQGVSGGGVRNETFYGESFIPAAYVERQFGDDFEVVAGKFDGQRYDQRFFLLRKK